MPTYYSEHPENQPREVFEEIAIPQGEFSWLIPLRPVEQLHITASPDVLHRIESVTIVIGGKRKSFDTAQFRRGMAPHPGFSRSARSAKPARK